MAKKKRPKQSWRKRLWALVDRKQVVTAVIIALVLGVPSLFFGGKWLYGYIQERQDKRTKISQEIRHRIPIARQHVIDDVNLAKKYLDGVDPRFCLHQELAGIPLRKLVDDWESAGGGEVGQEIDRLSAEPAPTPEQVQNLLASLDKVFPDSTLVGAAKEQPNRDEAKPIPPDVVKDQPTADVGDKLPPPPPLPTPPPPTQPAKE